jgi:Spy/CpxP family protein refolding chaperone
MRRAAFVAKYLGLTDQQKASWRALEEQQRERMKPLRAEGRELRTKLRQALDLEAPDATAVGEATLALKAHREKARAQREAFEQQLRALLSPEQQRKLDAMKAARRTLGRGRGDRFGRPGMRERRWDGASASPTPPVLG